MKQYMASYKHKGESFVLMYYAQDEQDAKIKLQSIKGNAKYDGEVVLHVKTSFLDKLIGWWKK